MLLHESLTTKHKQCQLLLLWMIYWLSDSSKGLLYTKVEVSQPWRQPKTERRLEKITITTLNQKVTGGGGCSQLMSGHLPGLWKKVSPTQRQHGNPGDQGSKRRNKTSSQLSHPTQVSSTAFSKRLINGSSQNDTETLVFCTISERIKCAQQQSVLFWIVMFKCV